MDNKIEVDGVIENVRIYNSFGLKQEAKNQTGSNTPKPGQQPPRIRHHTTYTHIYNHNQAQMSLS